ncbi:MAG: hypothetical protein C4K60_18160 [Ideonella sp. MAG2]|nr:MAG: hypothetical protein C4K60_18160 [Ideonella sp. MAG2]
MTSWLVSLPVMLFSAGPFFRGAWHSVKSRKVGMDVPVSLGLLVTFVASSGATFSPGGLFGHEVYFDSLTMFVSFLLGGRFVELMARHRAAESLESALAAMPETACRLLDDGTEEQVSLHRLRPGDRVRVSMGAAFPADGCLESGVTEADESVLTGESRPMPKREGLARRGVMVQRLDALEALARVDRLFVDKTGTLTEEKSRRVSVFSAPGVEIQGLGPAASALARWSSHPLSKALAEDPEWVEAAKQHAWQGVTEEAGQGLQAIDHDGHHWRLGALAWVANGETARPSWQARHDGLEVWMGRLDGDVWQPTACITFDEQVRPDARQAVAGLQRKGVALTLLSGDRPERAQALALQVGISEVVASASPKDKVAAVAAAQRRGERVGMVGDGVNDAPVLAMADVSMAMGQGALVSRVHADAVVLSNRLADVLLAHQLARKTMRVVRQNLIWAAAYNATCIPLALLGYLPPWAAGLGMALSSLAVIGNSLRLSRPLTREAA